MTQEELRQIRENIKGLITELEAVIKSLVQTTKPIAPDNAIGRLTRMEAINAKSISEASLASARMRLTRLQNTLKRLDNPGFGLCPACEEPIPFKRLMLLPDAVRCVRCTSG